MVGPAKVQHLVVETRDIVTPFRQVEDLKVYIIIDYQLNGSYMCSFYNCTYLCIPADTTGVLAIRLGGVLV